MVFWKGLRRQFNENNINIMICREIGGMVLSIRDMRRTKVEQKYLVMLHQVRSAMGCAVCDPEWKNAQIQHIVARKETILHFCYYQQ